jgi:hypothetical protein
VPTPVIACGTYVLNLQCPECGEVTEVPVFLDTRLTVDRGGAKLNGKLNGKPVDHLCGQLRIVPPARPDGPVTDPLFGEPGGPVDWAKRAAGDDS